ncbi:MAG TPA: tRNA-dihydrouridine synthase [Candidatus Sulfotelmatobacter sp.]|nr:tRNA-dihydrouridine synthase [Candidatus Sulfotelmatobacter sp.]
MYPIKKDKILAVLAPMDDVTDTVFRQIVDKCSPPDLTFTEFVNVDGLNSPGRSKLIKKLKFADSEKHLIAQIWGLNPDNFYTTAKQIADGSLAKELGVKGNFIGVDLNMGCPQKNEVNSGACAALMNNRALAKDIIEATKKGLNSRLPLSIKTRLGYTDIDYSWPEFLLNQNIDMLTIHGRTKRQKSKDKANWEAIGSIRELRDKMTPKTLIVGNGDVLSRKQGEELAKRYNLDGIMIGRGVFQDPFIFSKNSPWNNYTKEQKIRLFKKHVELFNKTWRPQDKPMVVLNKFCKVYINDFEGAKELRNELMHCRDIDDLTSKLDFVRSHV